MDTQLKARWVEALRSGEYKQGRMILEEDDRYCCLGVLCKIADIDTGDTGPAYRRLERLTGGYGPFVKMNDDERKSFIEIADYIEANL